jgi:hypothetical protein
MSSFSTAAPPEGDFEQFRKELECPVCLEIRKRPIFQCEDGGHIICCKCHGDLIIKTCPVCMGAYATPPSRNRVIERMIDRLNLPENCINGKNGCKFSGPQDALKIHEKDCLFRIVPCPDTSCDQGVVMHQLAGHAIAQHKARRVECTSNGVIKVAWGANIDHKDVHWKLTMVTVNGLLFFPVLFKKDNTYYAWLKNPSKDQSAVKVSLEGPKGMVSYNGHTIDIQTSTSSIMQRPDEMLTFNNMNAKQCATKDEHGEDIITVTFKIRDQMDKNVSTVAKKATLADILKDIRITIAKSSITDVVFWTPYLCLLTFSLLQLFEVLLRNLSVLLCSVLFLCLWDMLVGHVGHITLATYLAAVLFTFYSSTLYLCLCDIFLGYVGLHTLIYDYTLASHLAAVLFTFCSLTLIVKWEEGVRVLFCSALFLPIGLTARLKLWTEAVKLKDWEDILCEILLKSLSVLRLPIFYKNEGS